MDIKSLESSLNKLNSSIADILNQSHFTDYDDLSGLDNYEAIKQNPDSLQLLDEYMSILYKLQDISYTLDCFKKPIKESGYLVKGSNGRYSLNGIELSSGYGLEYLCTTDDRYYNYDADNNYSYWKVGRIEHNGTDYYIVGCSAEDITTVRVRIR